MVDFGYHLRICLRIFFSKNNIERVKRMNETEKAYQEFEDEAYHHSLHPEISEESKAVAMVALREKQEREKGCGWCKKFRMEFDCVDDDGNVVAIDNMVLGGECDHCPVCGRKLVK